MTRHVFVLLLLLAACILASPVFADETIPVSENVSCAIHEVDYGVRTIECLSEDMVSSRWICEYEGEVECRLRGDKTVIRHFIDPLDGHLCRSLCAVP